MLKRCYRGGYSVYTSLYRALNGLYKVYSMDTKVLQGVSGLSQVTSLFEHLSCVVDPHDIQEWGVQARVIQGLEGLQQSYRKHHHLHQFL